MRASLVLVFLFAVASSFAQSKEISASQFSELTIAGPFKVTLIKAAKSKVEIDYRSIDPKEVARSFIHSLIDNGNPIPGIGIDRDPCLYRK